MSLDRFREVAEEKTRHIAMTPELHARILAQVRGAPKRRHARIPVMAAAACLVVMAVSAGVLALGNQRQWFSENGLQVHGELLAAQPAELPLPEIYEQVVNLSPSIYEGVIEPRQDQDSGLWGYADADGNWIVEPAYAQAHPIEGMCGRVVTVNGEEELLILTKTE